MKNRRKKASYPVIFTEAEEGGYFATVPALPGCFSQGETFEETKRNIAEAMDLYLDVKRVTPNVSRDFVVAPISV